MCEKKQVVIIGAGGYAKVVVDIIRKKGLFVKGFLDDNEKLLGTCFFGVEVLGTTKDYCKFVEDCVFVIAIGNNNIRKRISNSLNCVWYTAIHPNACIAEGVEIGEGTVVMAGAVINSGSNLGKHCIINTCAIVEHDCKVGSYSHISPGGKICGNVTVGESVWLGAGSTVINCVSICDDTTVGAGAVVISDINESATYVGIPIKRIK